MSVNKNFIVIRGNPSHDEVANVIMQQLKEIFEQRAALQEQTENEGCACASDSSGFNLASLVNVEETNSVEHEHTGFGFLGNVFVQRVRETLVAFLRTLDPMSEFWIEEVAGENDMTENTSFNICFTNFNDRFNAHAIRVDLPSDLIEDRMSNKVEIISRICSNIGAEFMTLTRATYKVA